MERPIFEKVRAFRGGAYFAMPGHKSKALFDFGFADDITEIEGADNLLDPEGAILEGEAAIARAYGTAASYLIPAGSTAAIKVALYAATRPGDKVLVQRGAHTAFFHAAVHLDLIPVYLPCGTDPKTGLFCGIDPKEVGRALDADPEIAAVFLTSPDYFGGILQLEEIAREVEARNKVLVVDEAHGAHLAFTPLSAYSAVRFAHYTVQSLHKTAPAMTGAALLHTRCAGTEQAVRTGMRLFLSTSPSYLIMLSSEYAVAHMQAHSGEWHRIEDMRRTLAAALPEGAIPTRSGHFAAIDGSKFLFRLPHRTGREIVRDCAERGVYLEMGDDRYALVILSPLNKEDEIRRLEDVFREAEAGPYLPVRREAPYFHKRVELSPRAAFFAGREWVYIDDAVGRICALPVTPYPPGIPRISYGERIAAGDLDFEGHEGVQGIKDGKVAVVKEEL